MKEKVLLSSFYSLRGVVRDYRLPQWVTLETGRGTGAEMCPAIVSGMVTEDAPVSYWFFFFLSPVTVPEVFAKVNTVKFPFCFLSGESKTVSSLHQTFFAISKEYVLLAFRILFNLLNISTVDYIHSSLKPDVSDTAGNEC